MDQQLYKQDSIGFQIAKLPHEVIQIIFKSIPDHYLETYIDIPFIGDYSADIVYRFISIIPSDSRSLYYRGPQPKGLNLISQSRDFLSKYPNHSPNHPRNEEYKQLRASQFIQLLRKYSGLKPKNVHFERAKRFLWFHRRYPDILRQLPRIDISFKYGFPEFPLDKQYNNIYRVVDLPEKFEYHEKLLSSISSLTTECLPKWTERGWGDNIRELGLGYAPYEFPSRLFPNLKGLKLSGLRQNLPPNLPSSVEFLQVFFEGEFQELDISYLKNLREFEADTELHRLSAFTFPVGIERVIISGFCEFEEGHIHGTV